MDGSRTAVGGEPARRKAARRPAQRHAAHSDWATKAGAGPCPVTLAMGFSASTGAAVVAVQRDDPSTDAPAMQIHAHDRAHLEVEGGRDRVVENSFNRRHVRKDGRHACDC